MSGWMWVSTVFNYLSGYNWGDPVDYFTGYGYTHIGIDIKANKGDKVVSPQSGVVTSAGWSNAGYGNQVTILTSDGYSVKLAHFDKLFVKQGDKVDMGTVVGLAGSTGNSTGPHIHLEIKKGSTPVNPWNFFPENPTIGKIYDYGDSPGWSGETGNGNEEPPEDGTNPINSPGKPPATPGTGFSSTETGLFGRTYTFTTPAFIPGTTGKTYTFSVDWASVLAVIFGFLLIGGAIAGIFIKGKTEVISSVGKIAEGLSSAE